MTGLLPPQAPEIETAILGIALMEDGAIDEVLTHIDSAEYFYKLEHQAVFSAMLKLYHSDVRIDGMTVIEQLKKDGQLDNVGGVVFITSLITKSTPGIHLEEYCMILKQTAVKRAMISMGNELMKMGYDAGIDVNDMMTLAGDQLDKLTESLHGGTLFNDFGYYLKLSRDALYVREAMAKENKISGIPTPVNALTKTLNGWVNGDLVIIAARPSMGKTALALSSILKAAELGVPVNVYSLEMRGERLTDRIICGFAGVEHERYRSGYILQEELKDVERAIGKLERLPIYIDDYPLPTMDYIKSRTLVNKRRGRCGMVVIDYLQLIDSPYVKGQNREREVANISRKAKNIAHELNVPVLLLSQLNRSCEMRGDDKRPQLSDLRESGAIEQDADTVLMLYRAERYGIDEDKEGNSTKGRGEIIVTKQRDGAVGTVLFGYNPSLTKIFDYGAELEPVKDDELIF